MGYKTLTKYLDVPHYLQADTRWGDKALTGIVDGKNVTSTIIKLAFALFNKSHADIYDTFYLLDDKNFDLAINAIKLRFGR